MKAHYLFLLLTVLTAPYLVQSQSTLSGVVSYDNASSSVLGNVTVTLQPGGLSTVTNASGYYQFQNLAAGTYTLQLSSTTPWGGAASTDQLLVLKHWVKMSILTGIREKAAHVNMDAAVNALDARLIVKRFVGIISSFPNGDWQFEEFSLVVDGTTTYTQNIKGICTGDVNGSYVPPSYAFSNDPGFNLPALTDPENSLLLNKKSKQYSSLDPVPDNTTTLSASLQNILACPGNNILVPILVTGLTGVGSFNLAFNYDNTKVTYTGYQDLNPAFSGGLFLANGTTTQVRIALNSILPVDIGTATLITLKFNYIGGSCPFTFDLATFGDNIIGDDNDEIITCNFTNGSVTAPADPVISVQPAGVSICSFSTHTMTILATGGSGALLYQWQQSSVSCAGSWTDILSATSNSYTTQPLTSTTYFRCMVTQSGTSCGPVYSDCATVQVLSLPTASLSGSSNICQGGSANLNINITGGTPPYNINLSNGMSTTVYTNITTSPYVINVSPSVTTTYSIISVTDANGCMNMATGIATITVTNNPMGFMVTGGGSFCSGGDGVSVGLTGSQSGVTYYLDLNGSNTGISVLGTGTAITFGNQTNPGSYTVQAVNMQNCSAVMQGIATVMLNTSPVANAGTDQSIISGNAATLSGSATGGSGVYNYHWEPASMVVNPNQASTLTVPLSSTTAFTLQATDPSTLCYGTDNVTVNVTNPCIQVTAPVINQCSNPIAVPVTVSYAMGFASFSLQLNYNQSLLTYQSYTANPLLSGGMLNVNAVMGSLHISYFNISPVTIPNGATLLTANFNGLPGNSILTWNLIPGSCQFNDLDGSELCSEYVNGSINFGQSVSWTNPLQGQCISSTTYELTGGIPAGGTYSGQGVSGSNFNASIAGQGTHTLTYYYTSPGTGCTGSATNSIVVYSNPAEYSLNGGGFFCSGGNGVPVNLSGSETGVLYKLYLNSVYTGISISGNGTAISFGNQISPGSYTVIATSSQNCSATMQGDAMVVVGTPPVVNVSSNSPICQGMTLALTANASGGSGPYQYFWSGPNGFVSSTQNPVISNANPGQSGLYYVTVTGSDGCASVSSTAVVIYSNPTIGVQSNSPVCAGSAIQLSASGGNMYLWSGPNGFTSMIQNPLILNAVPSMSGTYTVTVTDMHGCSSVGSTSVVVNNPPTMNPVPNSILCNNDIQNAIIFSGPIPGTTFNWTNNNPAIGLGASGNGSIAAFAAINTTTAAIIATITVTPTANGCNGTAVTFSITVKPTPSVDPIPDQVYCNDQVTNAINITGPVSGTNFAWAIVNPGFGLSIFSGNNTIPSFTALNKNSVPVNGTINVTPTANGCTGIVSTITFTILPGPTSYGFDGYGEICQGGPGATLCLSNSQTGVTYELYLNGSPTGTTLAGTGAQLCFTGITQIGSYKVKGTFDNNGCSAWIGGTRIVSYYLPHIICPPNQQVNTNPQLCSSVVNGIDPSLLNNCPDFAITYSSTGASILNGNNSASGSVFNEGVTIVTYLVTDSDGNTGTCTFSVDVLDMQPPVISQCSKNVKVTLEQNPGGPCRIAVPDLTPDMEASDNCGPVIITQNPVAGTLLPSSHNQVHNVVMTVTDIAGNSSNCTAEITGDDLTPPQITCPDDIFSPCDQVVTFPDAIATDDCDATIVTQTGGLPSGSTFPVGTTVIIFQATDAAGNTSTCSFNVTVVEPISINYVTTDVICLGGSDGTITVTPSGGTAPYTYLWSNGATTSDVGGLVGGNDMVIVTDANGCSQTQIITINNLGYTCNGSSVVFDGLTYTANAGAGLMVSGDSLIIANLGDSLSVSLDLGSYTNFAAWYHFTNLPGAKITWNQWGDLNNIPNQLISSSTIEQINDTTHKLTCNYSMADQLHIACLYQGNVVYEDTIDNGTSITYTMSNVNKYDIEIIGGYEYFTLYGQGYYQGIMTDEVLVTGIYTDPLPINIYRSNLIGLDVSEIIIYRSIETSVSGNGMICHGNPVELIGTTAAYAGLQWQLNQDDIPGATLATYSTSTVGDYRLKVTVDDDTYISKAIHVVTPVLMIIVDQVQHVSCPGGDDGIISVTAIGGLAPYYYSWSNGATSQTIYGLTEGVYTVTVTDANGCVQIRVITITEPPDLILSVTPYSPACPGGPGGFYIVPSGGTPNYSVNISPCPMAAYPCQFDDWSGGFSTLPKYPAGTYTFTVTDANGCTATTTATIIDSPGMNLTYTITHGCPLNDIDLTVTGGFPPYSYQWSNGEITQDLAGVKPGTYTVTITDAFCPSQTITIIVYPLLPPICCPDFILKDAIDICPPLHACCPQPEQGNTKNAPIIDDCDTIAACKNTPHTYTVYPNRSDYSYTWTVTGGVPTSYTGNPLTILWGTGTSGYIKVVIKGLLDGGCCEDSILMKVCLIDGPEAAFSFDPSVDPICKKDVISFFNHSGGSKWHWEFGDKTTSDVFEPTHQYAAAGTYKVLLTVTDMGEGRIITSYMGEDTIETKIPCGCTDTISHEITIVAEEGPDILYNCCYECKEGTVCAGDTSTFCTSADCVTYNWTVVGGTILSGTNTSCISVKWNTILSPVTSVSLETPGCGSLCQGKTTMYVPVFYPDFDITGTGPTVCVGTSNSYSIPHMPGTYYEWIVTGGGGVGYYFNKADKNVSTVNITFTNPGTYTIHCHYTNPLANCGPGVSKNYVVHVLRVFAFYDGAVTVCEGTPGITYHTNGPISSCSVTPAGASITSWGGNAITIDWNTPGIYTITANTSSTAYCNTSAIRVVKVIANPVLGNITGPLTVCPGVNYTYHISSNTVGYPFNWTPGSGVDILSTMGDFKDSVVVRWKTTGNYTLQVTQMITPYNCWSSTSINVTVWPAPDISSASSSACVDDIVTYNATGSDPNGNYEWSINPPKQGTIISGQGTKDVAIRWNGTASNSAVLTVTGCGGSDTYVVTIYGVPVNVLYTPDPPLFCLNDVATVVLTADPSSCSGCTFNWFSNISGLVGSGPTYTVNIASFTVAGNYEYWVELTQNGCKTISKRVIVKVDKCYCNGGCHDNDPDPDLPTNCPNSKAKYQYYPLCNKIIFKNASKVNPGYAITSYNWSVIPSAGCSFSLSSSDPNPELTVPATGNYTITLETTDNDTPPCHSTYTRTVYIRLPQADFYHTIPICADEAASFVSIYSPDNNDPRYSWDFGDLSYSYDKDPVKSYENTTPWPQPYWVTLTINDKYGCSDSKTELITVNPAPSCLITSVDTVICPGDFETLTATCSGMISYQWYKDSIAIPGATNTTYDAYQYGNYWVEITNTYGCKGRSDSIYIYLLEEPEAAITGPKLFCMYPMSTNSFELKTPYYPNYTYSWSSSLPLTSLVSFTDNNTNAGYKTTVTFNAPSIYYTAIYYFTVTVTDNTTLCQATNTICIAFYNKPVVTVPTLNICEGAEHLLSPNPLDSLKYSYLWNNADTTPIIKAIAPGFYSLIMTDRESGCSDTADAGFIFPKPDVSLFPRGCDTLCQTTTTGAYYYSLYIPLPLDQGDPNFFPSPDYPIITWYDNGVPVGGGQTFLYSSTVLGLHHISVVVQNKYGCSDTASILCLDVKNCNEKIRRICRETPYHPGIIPNFNYSTLLWTATGSGYFDNPTALYPVYYPGEYDTIVTLSLFAQPVINPPIDTMILVDHVEVRYVLCDYGDAPDDGVNYQFHTLLANNGARHIMNTNYHIGSCVDWEINGLQNSFADGDDNSISYPNCGDDEEGVTFLTPIYRGKTVKIEVVASVNGYLDAWMDFNHDFKWTGSNEHILTKEAVTNSTNYLSFTVPSSAVIGTSYVRFRFRTANTYISYEGLLPDGEVEDYMVNIDSLPCPPACESFNDGTSNFMIYSNNGGDIYNTTDGLTIQAPGSQGYAGDLGLRVADISGSTWLYNNTADYSGDYLHCPNSCLCWDMNMEQNDHDYYPSIFMFRGFNVNAPVGPGNPQYLARYTSTSLTGFNTWVHTCARLKPAAGNVPPSSSDGAWTWLYYPTGPVPDWNTFISDIDGIMFRVDVDGWGGQEIFRLDSICMEPCDNAPCDTCIVYVNSIPAGIPVAYNLTSPAMSGTTNTPYSITFCHPGSPDPQLTVTAPASHNGTPFLHWHRNTSCINGSPNAYTITVDHSWCGDTLMAIYGDTTGCPPACENFNDLTSSFRMYNELNGVVTDETSDNMYIDEPGSMGYAGDNGLFVFDHAGATWIYNNTPEFTGNYLACPYNCLCWDQYVFYNIDPFFKPYIYLYRGFDPNLPMSPTNPQLLARYTSNTDLYNSDWGHTCARIKPSSGNNPPFSLDGNWTWVNGSMPWNAFISNIEGIMFRVDITGWGGMEGMIFDSICLSPCPTPPPCDTCIVYVNSIPSGIPVAYNLTSPAMSGTTNTPYSITFCHPGSPDPQLTVTAPATHNGVPFLHWHRNTSCITGSPNTYTITVDHSWCGDTLMAIYGDTTQCPPACENFNDGASNFKMYNDLNGVITHPTASNTYIDEPGSQGYTGDKALYVFDRAGDTWLYNNSSDFTGNYLVCPNNCLCWDQMVTYNIDPAFNPYIYLFRGFDPNLPLSSTNPQFLARFTSIPSVTNNNWGHTCARLKPAMGNNPPFSSDGSWTWVNGFLPWNAFISNIEGIMFRVDITSWDGFEGMIFDSICLEDCSDDIATLTVDSQGWCPNDPGKTITVSKVDLNGQSDGDPTFIRQYAIGDLVTLTAPGECGIVAVNACFKYWLVDGVLYTVSQPSFITGSVFNPQITINMNQDHRLTAVYGPCCNTIYNKSTLDGSYVTGYGTNFSPVPDCDWPTVPLSPGYTDFNVSWDCTNPRTATFSITNPSILYYFKYFAGWELKPQFTPNDGAIINLNTGPYTFNLQYDATLTQRWMRRNIETYLCEGIPNDPGGCPASEFCISNITMPVHVWNFGEIASFSLTLNYDADALQFTGVQNLNPELNPGVFVSNADANQIFLVCSTLMELTFTGETGNYNFSWDLTTPGACEYSDINEKVLEASFQDHDILVHPCTNVTGNVVYKNIMETPMDNTTVFLEQQGTNINTTITDLSGYFDLPDVEPGSYSLDFSTTKPWAGGNATDGLLILKHFVELDTLSGLNREAGDVNCDGVINAADALQVVRRFVGQITNFFPCSDWLFDSAYFNLGDDTTLYFLIHSLCRGDVNGSHYPSPTFKTAPDIFLDRDGTEMITGESVTIPVRVTSKQTVGAISMVLEIPESCIKVEGVSVSNEGFTTFKQTNTEVRIGWYSLTPLSLMPGDVLLKLQGRINPAMLNDPDCMNWSLGAETALSDEHAKSLTDIHLTYPRLVIQSEVSYLGQNKPNPLSSITEIPYYLAESGMVSLRVYDMLGNEVAVLVNQHQESGSYQVNMNCAGLPSGVYTYKIEVSGNQRFFSKALRMIIER
ncbi:MAG: HYR domain-containing protein [Bacteroidetes bacterium]|nr:HYR domain-containing protein [Bacteroidota bacterium]